ncbi:MAG: RNA-binding cell elongation regulator Jag/EloR [Desulfovibrionaceae bacterium]
MSGYQEFQGKNLDEAIEEACKCFELKREKLEIEILSGGSSGIFGLVGVKKARVKARPRSGVKSPACEARTAETEQAASKSQEATVAPAPAPRAESAPAVRQEAMPPAKKEPAQPAVRAEDEDEAKPRSRKEEPSAPRREGRRRGPRSERAPADKQAEAEQDVVPIDAEDEDEEHVDSNWSQQVDRETLEKHVREVLAELLKSVNPELNLRISEENSRLDVYIDDDENSGLIIGREGQTLAALQYMVNRIVSRRVSANVRIQLDTGDYREKQNDRLRRLAQDLAERAKSGGRVQSTKPLSSYHRRVVHMALQGDDAIQTRSKGEGPMKKVLILPKRRGPRKQSNQDNY